MLNFPFVIWMGRQPLRPKQGRLFRIVHRGPARPARADDVPFAVEVRSGVDSMKVEHWGKANRENGAEQEAMYAMVHALGQLLCVDPKKLDLNHPLYCECNMAVVEGRESRGCDCKAPADPPRCQRLDQAMADTPESDNP